MKILTHFERDLVRVSVARGDLTLNAFPRREQSNIRLVAFWALQRSTSGNQTDWSAGAIVFSGSESEKPRCDQDKYSGERLSKQLPHVSKIHSFLMLLF
jgi:hypothetical protein